jgi:2-polyprenyl-3-methyl-5-hydroxy-6-metoxy-1,4-benzoquinol methylase
MIEGKDFFLLSETASQFLINNKLKEEYSLHLTECPVCEGRKFRRIFKHDGFTYFRCNKCSFVFVNPRLNDKGSQIWYNSQYYDSALNWEIYFNKIKETYYSVSLNSKHFNKLIDLIKVKFENKNLKIIDIGCATGSILSYLRNELDYSNLEGIDLNKKAVEFARETRNLNVNYADITKIAKSNLLYDLVISTENIEHVNDVKLFIKNISAILKINGHLIISTPHNDYKAVKALGLFGDHFCAPNHINFFNASNLSQFLRKHGYEIITIWLDEIKPINILEIIKSRLFLPDQVISNPPYEAFFTRPLYGSIKKRRKFVKLRKIDRVDYQNETNEVIINNKVFKTLKKILKTPFNIETKKHMIVIAQKIR